MTQTKKILVVDDEKNIHFRLPHYYANCKKLMKIINRGKSLGDDAYVT